MIKKYIVGNPIETEAVIKEIQPEKNAIQELNYNGQSLSFSMNDSDIVYGLGETVRGINKRGWIYESYCMDDYLHTEDRHSLYAAHNFLMISGAANIGLFIDYPGRVTFDIGYTHLNELTISPKTQDFYLYIIEEASPDKIITSFRELIGTSYIPPKWAFGYGQSRWSYMSADEVRAVAKGHRDAGIPIDSIYLDIDYMDRYKDFTIDDTSFPDFESFVSELKNQNIHLVPIIDGGVKVEDGYDVYEEGKANDYFCKDKDGQDFIVGVWPGNCCFPDMLNDKARAWFGDKYKILIDKGIEGFWNDMNEPATFYSANRLKEAQQKIANMDCSNLGLKEVNELDSTVFSLKNSDEDYASFYHNMNGQKVCHIDVHNLFGYYMTRSASEAFDRIEPDKRLLMYSRASYIGMHRYGGVWQGDNMAWWSHLLLNLKMMPSLNMCGFLYTGADLGGFGSDTTEDLMIRWLSFAVFTPLMRNHAAMDTRRQEVYDFDSSALAREVIRIRYKLLPYIYSEFVKAALGNTMMFRPLGFVYSDDIIAKQCEDQLLVGDEIMIAPVYSQNTTGRIVYIPENMQLIRFSKDTYTLENKYSKGHHYIEMPLGDVCIFLKENRSLPIGPGGEYVSDALWQNLSVLRYGNEPLPYKLYNDDGYTKDISLDNLISL